MKEKEISKTYATSLVQLSESKNVDVVSDLNTLIEAIDQNPNLESLLFLEIFSEGEKKSVLKDLSAKMNISELTLKFLEYLVDEKRISLLPLVTKEVVNVFDEKNNVVKGVIEGVQPEISESDKETLIKKMEPYIHGKKVSLHYKVNKQLTAGYRLTIDGLQLDATLENQLKNFKEAIITK